MATSQATRTRQSYRVRVRSGCLTCRQRRVKCDEAKPHCNRCTSTGRTCDGYAARTSDTNPTLLTTTAYSLPFRIPGSQEDRQLLHYYHIHASKDICGFSLEFRDFWERLILQTSFHEPVVRHMLIAIASIHRDYATSTPGSAAIASPSFTTLERYNKALRRFRLYVSRSSVREAEPMMACCILFHCFESIRGEYEWAVKHLSTGLQILESCESARSDNSVVSRSQEGRMAALKRALIRLDYHLSVFNDSRMPAFCLAPRTAGADMTQGVDMHFESLIEAENALNALQNWLLRLLISGYQYKPVSAEEMPSEFREELQSLWLQLAGWNTAYQNLKPPVRTDPTEARAQEMSKSMMQVMFNLGSAMLLFSYPQAISDGKQLPRHMDNILTGIQSLLSLQDASRDSTLRSISCDMGVVMPLFLLSAKCRDANLRVQTLDMLAGLSRQEGLLNSQTMADILTKVTQLEINGHIFSLKTEDLAVEDWASMGVDLAGDYSELAERLGLDRKVQLASTPEAE